MDDDRERVAGWLRFQAEWCGALGSPLYEHLLTESVADIARDGPVWAVLHDHASDPADSALALRLMGAVHRLVLEGRAPELAEYFPSAGGNRSIEGAWEAFVALVDAAGTELRQLVHRGVQTNEVGRSAALAPGFLTVGAETRLPLRILETGASAGLNLRWDHYRYEARGLTWGDSSSPVRLCDYNSERPLPFDITAHVVERAGCDRDPLNPTVSEDQLTLLSYVWPDQIARIRLLRAALEVAARVPGTVEKAGAPEWLASKLAAPVEGAATVVFHSIFFQYLEPEDRVRFVSVIEDAGGRASERAPLAWLRMEPGGEVAEVRLTTWPGGTERLIATAGYHGAAVRWLG